MSSKTTPVHNKKVILLPEPQVWTFWTYVGDDGVDVIEEWYEFLSFDAQVAFDKMLKQTYKVKNHLEWIAYRHKLNGKQYKKIWELEFTADKRANRVLCVFNGIKQAVMLCGCYHKGSLWHPSNALEQTLKRAQKVENGTAKLKVKEIEDSI